MARMNVSEEAYAAGCAAAGQDRIAALEAQLAEANEDLRQMTKQWNAAQDGFQAAMVQLDEARKAAEIIKELAIEQEPVSIGNQWAWRKVEFLTRSITAPHPTEKEKPCSGIS